MQSFHFDENTGTLDAYITCKRQVATLLDYAEPPILEVFKNIPPTILYCILFLIDDLRQVVEMPKRILAKEKIDRTGDRSRSRERSYLDNSGRRDRSSHNSRSRSGSRASTNRDRIRCYKCRKYDHFAKDCPTTREEREIEQIQQMFNLDEEQMLL